MKKRLKQKLGNKYNLLRRAKRQKLKRKGKQYIEYAHIPMGERDTISFIQEGYKLEYPHATHWFIEIVPSAYYSKEPYIIYTYPVTSKGGSETNLFLSIVDAGKLEEILPSFIGTVDKMKNDIYIESLFDLGVSGKSM